MLATIQNPRRFNAVPLSVESLVHKSTSYGFVSRWSMQDRNCLCKFLHNFQFCASESILHPMYFIRSDNFSLWCHPLLHVFKTLKLCISNIALVWSHFCITFSLVCCRASVRVLHVYQRHETRMWGWCFAHLSTSFTWLLLILCAIRYESLVLALCFAHLSTLFFAPSDTSL